MADISSIMKSIVGALDAPLSELGFKAVIPEGVQKGELPAVAHADKLTVEFAGEGKAIRLEYFERRLALLAAAKEGEIGDGDFTQLSMTLLDPDEANDKDVKSIVNEVADTVASKFPNGQAKALKSKLPPPVSKAAVKSGAAVYDANTFANRFTTIYPELREEYKNNCEKYGEFLPEEFFLSHGNAVILAEIKANNPTRMKKLFNLLNEIYDDGTNDIQSLIAVTILGALDNDQELLANCVDYMSSDMCPMVIQINRYLASSNGKSAKLRLENPPKFKPKKQKKGGLMSTLNQAQQQSGR